MIRKADINDINDINKLLFEVHDIHAKLRPDIFIEGKKKYNNDELLEIIKSNDSPIFVYAMDGKVVGYVFLKIKTTSSESTYLRKEVYIDDLCVDEEYRKCAIGSKLCDYVINYAKEINADAVTLNVWEGNSAKEFYEKIGFKPQRVFMEKIIK